MKYIFHIIISSVLFLACTNVEKPVAKKTQIEVSYIGAQVPIFKSKPVNNLVRMYEEDRTKFYKAKENNDIPSYYKQKIEDKDGYEVTNFYEDALNILEVNGDKAEIKKFQDYIAATSIKSKEFLGKLKK